ALQPHAAGVAAEHEVEVALDGQSFEVADGDVVALHDDARRLRGETVQRDRAAEDDRAAAEPCANRVDVEAGPLGDGRAGEVGGGDVVDEVGEGGEAELRVGEVGGAGQARLAQRAGDAEADDDVAVGAEAGDEELHQRRFELAAHVDVDALAAADLGVAGDGE